MRYASFGIVVWLIGQMIINVGMVLALLPVIGIPLPLISYGGSSLLPSLVALGLLIGFARREPEAAPALAARRRGRAAGVAAGAGRAPQPRPPRLSPMRILLAGGGTAGHTSPLLATADALRRLDPTVEITCLGTPRGLENTVVPAAGYPLELVPPVPLPRKPGARPAQGARADASTRSARPTPCSTASTPTSSSATAATSRCRPTSPPASAACPSSCTSRTRCPAWATSSAPGSPRAAAAGSRSASPTPRCPAPSTSACRSGG